MKKKGKILLSIGTFLLLLIVWMVGNTNAAPKAEDKKEAQTYLGDLKIDVVDTGNIGNLTVNTAQARKIELKNDGQTSQFVRVMILPVFVDDSGVLQEIKLSDLAVDLNTTNWKDGGDGYFYFLDILKANATTSSVFTQIKVPGSFGKGQLSLHVKAEAITAGGNQYRQAFWNSTAAQTVEPLLSIDNTLDGKKE